jgi:hypothetical protein
MVGRFGRNDDFVVGWTVAEANLVGGEAGFSTSLRFGRNDDFSCVFWLRRQTNLA